MVLRNMSPAARALRVPWADGVVIALLALGAVFLFARLGNGCLWQDEAETALLARHTLRFGYPRATDGRNAIEIEPFGYGPGQSWVYSPWLPDYLLAGVFALFGESTTAARLPFAAAGWLSLLLAWRLAARLTPDRAVHRLTVALLACSVPFLLHMRQCRYYALTAALILGVCLAALAYHDKPDRRTGAWLAGLLVLLFHANFGAFVPTVAAVAAHHLLFRPQAPWRRTAILGGCVAALTVPWALFFYRPGFVGAPSAARAIHHAEFYARVANKYLVPMAFMLLVTLGRLLMKRRAPGPPVNRPAARLIALVVICTFAFLVFVPDQRHLRYLILVLPLLAMGEAWWLAGWWRRSRLVGGFVIALAVLTTVWHAPPPPRVPLAQFFDELTHAYTGPMDGVVAYLRAHGRAEERVKIPYDDRTLMFYTDLRVELPSRFLEDTDPDWIVIRRAWIPEAFYTGPLFRRVQAAYDTIVLEAPDVQWQNREDPGEHHFRAVQGALPVVLYHKRKG